MKQSSFTVEDVATTTSMKSVSNENKSKKKRKITFDVIDPLLLEIPIRRIQYSIHMYLEKQIAVPEAASQLITRKELNHVIQDCNSTLEGALPHPWMFYSLVFLPYIILLPILIVGNLAEYLYVLIPIIASCISIGLLLFLHQIIIHQLLGAVEKYLMKKNRDYLHDGRDCHWYEISCFFDFFHLQLCRRLIRNEPLCIGLFVGFSVDHMDHFANEPVRIPHIDVESGKITFPKNHPDAVASPMHSYSTLRSVNSFSTDDLLTDADSPR
jgi:hypothetical protein